jgi:hypothetical protein
MVVVDTACMVVTGCRDCSLVGCKVSTVVAVHRVGLHTKKGERMFSLPCQIRSRSAPPACLFSGCLYLSTLSWNRTFSQARRRRKKPRVRHKTYTPLAWYVKMAFCCLVCYNNWSDGLYRSCVPLVVMWRRRHALTVASSGEVPR